ncbi:MAG TPA: hypothetical protein VH520_11085 [Streptosporangiaceae bacterium]
MRTDTGRVSRNAAAAATRARPVRRPARDRAGSSALHPQTGLALIAVGLVLLLAVRVHTTSVDLQTAGFILAGTGLTWLWAPVKEKKALLRRWVYHAVTYISWDESEPTARGTLADLLADAGGAGTPAGDTSRQGPHI